jgi:hypothetical protein
MQTERCCVKAAFRVGDYPVLWVPVPNKTALLVWSTHWSSLSKGEEGRRDADCRRSTSRARNIKAYSDQKV